MRWFSRGARQLLLLGLLLLMVNLPLVDATRRGHQLEAEGRTVTVAARPGAPGGEAPGGFTPVEVTLPEAVARAYRAQATTVPVDDATYRRVERTGRLDVTYLPDRPSSFEVAGQREGHGALVLTLLLDLVLLLVAFVLWRFRGRLRPEIVLAATEDLRPGGPDPLLEAEDGGLQLARGRVVEVADDQVVLQVADRRVRVHLDGHRNPLEPGGDAEARGRVVG